jgi:hypothetical protein
VKEQLGYPVQNCPSGSFFFWGGPVGRGGIGYDIVWRGPTQKDTLDNVAYTCMLSYPIVVSHLSFNFLRLLLLYSIYLGGYNNPMPELTLFPSQGSMNSATAKLVRWTANEGPVRIQYKCLVPIYVFLEVKQNYNVLSPSSYSHISVRDLHIFPGSVCLFCWRKICGPILGIYKSLNDTWMWKLRLRPSDSQKRNT